MQPTEQPTATANEFIMKVAEGGKKELAAGKLGVEKANHADVKAFAQRMVTDHTKANEELMSLAKAKNVTVDKPEPAGKAVTDDMKTPPVALDNLTGAAFNRACTDQARIAVGR